MSQAQNTGYADLKQIKMRLQISDSIKTADEKIQGFMREADSYINNQLQPFTTTPINNPDDEIKTLGSSLAAAFYNYWQSPQGTTEGIKEWKKAIQTHVKANFFKATEEGLSDNTITKTASAISGNE